MASEINSSEFVSVGASCTIWQHSTAKLTKCDCGQGKNTPICRLRKIVSVMAHNTTLQTCRYVVLFNALLQPGVAS
eukprot:364807-Chlamydomonas_euryale.AAC.8